jgi:8-oxo-dGTP diphosphatase
MSVDKSDPNVAREMQKNATRNVAVVGVFDSDGRILLVRTKRLPSKWQPIGGGMKPYDQTPLETVKRELREEIGLDLPDEAFELQLTTNYDFGEGKVYFYTTNLPAGASLNFDASELEEWKWVPWEAVQSLEMFPATQSFIAHLDKRRVT